MVNLTEIEKKAIKGIINSEYHDGANPVNNHIWTWSAGRDFENGKVFSGAISSLCKKGFVKSYQGNKKDDDTLVLTQEGFDAYITDECNN